MASNSEKNERVAAEESRREFMKQAGKLAVYTPPAVVLLMRPSVNAIAQSAAPSYPSQSTWSDEPFQPIGPGQVPQSSGPGGSTITSSPDEGDALPGAGGGAGEFVVQGAGRRNNQFWLWRWLTFWN